MRSSNRLLLIFMFFNSIIFARNLKIYNPNAYVNMEVRFDNRFKIIRPHTSTTIVGIPNSKITLDFYWSYPSQYINLFRITLKAGNKNLELDEKDFESIAEGLTPREKAITVD